MEETCASCSLRRKVSSGWTRLVAAVLLTTLLLAQNVPAQPGTAEQKFVEMPSDQKVIAGSRATMRCSVANLIGTLQWTKDGFGLGTERDLPGYDRYSMVGSEQNGEYYLMIEDTRLEDDGTYQCQVGATATISGIRSTDAYLIVQVPPSRPEIQDGPVIRIPAGKPYNLTCTARDGRPAPNITWSTAGENITDNVYYYVAAQKDGKRQDALSVLTIVPTVENDQGRKFTCKVTHVALFAPRTDTATIEVLYPPVIELNQQPARNLREFSTVSFNCKAQANPNTVSRKWYWDEREIPGEDGSYMEMSSISKEYNGRTITCEVWNEIGTVKASLRLNVLYRPRFINQPKHVDVDLGQAATLECRVTGNPQPSIVWKKKSSDNILSNKETLTLSDVRDGDFGRYVCSARAPGFSEISMEVQLLKRSPPRIISESQQYVRRGDDAQVTCMAFSVPKPKKMSWTRNGVDVIGFKRYSVFDEDYDTGRISYLKIFNTRLEDYGDYNCSVINDYGHTNMIINLLEQETVPLRYVLGGVMGGVFIILLVAMVLCICNRRRNKNGASSGDTFDDKQVTSNKKPNGDVKLKYDSDNNRYSSNLEPWQKNPDQGYYRYSADDDEFKLIPLRDFKPVTNGPLTNGGSHTIGRGPPKHDYPDLMPELDPAYRRHTLKPHRAFQICTFPHYNNRHDNSFSSCNSRQPLNTSFSSTQSSILSGSRLPPFDHPGGNSHAPKPQYSVNFELSDDPRGGRDAVRETEVPTLSKLSTNV